MILRTMAVVLSAAVAPAAIAADAVVPPGSDLDDAVRILPVCEYSGDLASRSTLTGDWGGARDDLARAGVFVRADLTYTLGRLASGGKDLDLRPRRPGIPRIDVDADRGANGGSFVASVDVDTGAAGLWPGGLVHVRFTSRWGDSLNDDAGALLPVSTGAAVPASPHQSEAALSAWNFTQFLSPEFGVALGKFDTTEGDPNPFASNERDTFQNLSLLLPTVGLRTLPDSVLGASLVWRPDDCTIVTLLAADSEGQATESGFDTIQEDGTTLVPMISHTRGIGGLPGGQRLGATWSSARYTSLEQDPRLAFLGAVIAGRAPETGTNSWSVFADGWQYVDVREGSEDLGWGVFWRVGVADADTSFVQAQYAGGVGGRGGFGCRRDDSWGVGLFYTDLSGELAGRHLTAEKGAEAFYNVAVTPWMHLTPSVQVIDPGVREFGTVVLAALRLQIDF